MAASDISSYNKTGNWKKDIGWEEIDKWRYEENLPYNAIRARSIELCQSAPSKGTLSSHFNPAVLKKAMIRHREQRQTLKGKVQRSVWRGRNRSRKMTANPPTERTNNYTTLRENIRVSLKEFRRNAAGGSTGIMINEYLKTWEQRDNLVMHSDEHWTIDCHICGINYNLKEGFNFDHIIPASKGGTDTPSNSALVHKECNMVKADLTMQELQILIKRIEKNGRIS